MTLKDTNPKDQVAAGKIPLHLLSPLASAHWALAQFAGMCKYGAWNWRITGVRASVYISAMERHIAAYKSGEEEDPTDKTHHLGNVMACAAILLDAEEAGVLEDDRAPLAVVALRSAYGKLEELTVYLRDKYKDHKPKHCTIWDTRAPDVVVHTESPDPAPLSPTLPSAARVPCSVKDPHRCDLFEDLLPCPLTDTDPDADPPPSIDVPEPFTQKEYIRPDHLYRVLHLRQGKVIDTYQAEDAPAAFSAVDAFSAFAKDFDRVSVVKGGELLFTKEINVNAG